MWHRIFGVCHTKVKKKKEKTAYWVSFCIQTEQENDITCCELHRLWSKTTAWSESDPPELRDHMKCNKSRVDASQDFSYPEQAIQALPALVFSSVKWQ